MGSQDTPDLPPDPAPPAEAIDVESASNLEKSLLKRRKGMKESFLTKGQGLRKLGELGTKNE